MKKHKIFLLLIIISFLIFLTLIFIPKNSIINISSSIGENDRYSEKEYYGKALLMMSNITSNLLKLLLKILIYWQDIPAQELKPCLMIYII